MKKINVLATTVLNLAFLSLLIIYNVIMSVGVSSKVARASEIINFLIVFCSNLILSGGCFITATILQILLKKFFKGNLVTTIFIVLSEVIKIEGTILILSLINAISHDPKTPFIVILILLATAIFLVDAFLFIKKFVTNKKI